MTVGAAGGYFFTTRFLVTFGLLTPAMPAGPCPPDLCKRMVRGTDTLLALLRATFELEADRLRYLLRLRGPACPGN